MPTPHHHLVASSARQSLDYFSAGTISSRNWKVQKVIEFIQANFHREITAEALASDVGLSVSRLHHLFKSEIGISPITYLKLIRMQEAKRLLETTTMNIKEIMCKVGVHDASHFVRDFKKLYRQSPTQYRATIGLQKCIEANETRQIAESA
jgi:transcriptional regulator GlxA family with amidase domain